MADAGDSKSFARKGVWVQIPPPAPIAASPLLFSEVVLVKPLNQVVPPLGNSETVVHH